MRNLSYKIACKIACTVALWLLKGLCIGFGALVAWRVCHALGTM